jgi:D-3-phosphoglycerate dehydrogenase / 2-oxoglutarate reductase
MKLLILSPIDPDAIKRLRSHHHVVTANGASDAAIRALIRDRDALVFRSGVDVSAELMQHAPNLRLLIRAGSGFDNVDLADAARRGIEFVRIPEPAARAVAELTFALLLALARHIVHADSQWRQGRWVKHELPGYLLRDKVLGIVGVGNIGTQVGELAVAWGMTVLGCHENPSAVAAALRAKGIVITSFDEVISQSDFVTVHVPLKESTRHLIDGAVLARMKRGSFLLNLARGGVVDELALRAELLTGERLLGAALDVHEAEGEGRISPLADLPNVVLTPHIGATTVDTQRDIGQRIVSIVDAWSVHDSLMTGSGGSLRQDHAASPASWEVAP